MELPHEAELCVAVGLVAASGLRSCLAGCGRRGDVTFATTTGVVAIEEEAATDCRDACVSLGEGAVVVHAWSEDGKIVAAARGRRVRVVVCGGEASSIDCCGEVKDMALLSNDGSQRLVVATFAGLEIFDDVINRSIHWPGTCLVAVASRRQQVLVAALDGAMGLFQNDVLRRLEGPAVDGRVCSLVVSEAVFAAVCWDGLVVSWSNDTTPKELWRKPASAGLPGPAFIASSPDGLKLAVTGGHSSNVAATIYEATTGVALSKLIAPYSGVAVRGLCLVDSRLALAVEQSEGGPPRGCRPRRARVLVYGAWADLETSILATVRDPTGVVIRLDANGRLTPTSPSTSLLKGPTEATAVLAPVTSSSSSYVGFYRENSSPHTALCWLAGVRGGELAVEGPFALTLGTAWAFDCGFATGGVTLLLFRDGSLRAVVCAPRANVCRVLTTTDPKLLLCDPDLEDLAKIDAAASRPSSSS